MKTIKRKKGIKKMKVVNWKLFISWVIILSISLGILTGFLVSNKINDNNRYYATPIVSYIVKDGDTLESISEKISEENNFDKRLVKEDIKNQNIFLIERKDCELYKNETIHIRTYR